MNNKLYEFMYEHAGYSYYPAKETEEEGRERTARELAEAYEKYLNDPELDIEWAIDPDVRSSDWSDETDYETWGAVLVNSETGEPLAGLFGIDLGGDIPTGNSYADVIEAELALEFYNNP